MSPRQHYTRLPALLSELQPYDEYGEDSADHLQRNVSTSGLSLGKMGTRR